MDGFGFHGDLLDELGVRLRVRPALDIPGQYSWSASAFQW
jgi:hypothetical protein